MPATMRARLLVIVTVMLVFLPVNYFGDIGIDDVEFIERLELELGHFNGIGSFFPSRSPRYYRPLLEVISLVDYKIWGFQYTGYHLTNYLAHIINSLLVFSIALALFKEHPFKEKISIVTSLLFALHPLVCESTAWISGRSDLFGAMFSLAAFRMILLDRSIKYALVPLFIALGLMCKENALSMIPIVILSHILMEYSNQRDIKDVIRSTLVWVVIVSLILLLYIMVRTGWGRDFHYHYVSLNLSGESANGLQEASTGVRDVLLNLAAATAFYVKKLFIPFPLNFAISSINLSLYVGLFFVLSLLHIYLLIKRKFYYLILSSMVFFSFMPALPVAMGGVAWMPFAERYLYLSTAVFSVILSVLVFRERNEKFSKFGIVFISVLLCVLCVVTFSRIMVWQNSKTLFGDTLEKNPENGKILYKYGRSVGGDEGRVYFEKSILIPNGDWKDFSYLALAEGDVNLGHHKKALNNIERALEIRPSADNYIHAIRIINRIPAEGLQEKRQKNEMILSFYKKAFKKMRSPFILYSIGKYNNLLGDEKNSLDAYYDLIARFPDSQYAGYSRTILKKYESKKSGTNESQTE